MLFKIGDFDPDDDGTAGESSCNNQAPKVEDSEPEEQVTGVEGRTCDDKADCKAKPGSTVLMCEWLSSDEEEEFPSWNHNEQPGFMSKYRVDSHYPPVTKHQKAQRSITFIHSKQPDVFAELFHTLFYTIAMILDNQADKSLRRLDTHSHSFSQLKLLPGAIDLLQH